MTEQHECEWTISISGVFCVNVDCQEEMSFDEAEDRIAASKRLSASQARRARYGYQYEDVDKALAAYANTLEGKC